MLNFLIALWVIVAIPGLILGVRTLIENDPKFGPGWKRAWVWALALSSLVPVVNLATAFLAVLMAIGIVRDSLVNKLKYKLACYSCMRIPVITEMKDPDTGETYKAWTNAIHINRCIHCGCNDIDQVIKGAVDLYVCTKCQHTKGSVPDWNIANNWAAHFYMYSRTKTIWELYKISRQPDFDEADFFNFVQSRIKE